jgi:hypothetical protein
MPIFAPAHEARIRQLIREEIREEIRAVRAEDAAAEAKAAAIRAEEARPRIEAIRKKWWSQVLADTNLCRLELGQAPGPIPDEAASWPDVVDLVRRHYPEFQAPDPGGAPDAG